MKCKSLSTIICISIGGNLEDGSEGNTNDNLEETTEYVYNDEGEAYYYYEDGERKHFMVHN